MQQLSCGLCCFHPLRHSSVLVDAHRSRSVSFLSLLLCTGKQPITKQNLLFVPSNPKLQPSSFPSYTHHCLSKLFRLPASPFLQDSTLHAGHKFKELTVQCPHTVLAPAFCAFTYEKFLVSCLSLQFLTTPSLLFLITVSSTLS